MVQCWHLDHQQRPTFQLLVENFNSFLEKESGYLELVASGKGDDLPIALLSSLPPSSSLDEKETMEMSV